jgi:hypothetical protein
MAVFDHVINGMNNIPTAENEKQMEINAVKQIAKNNGYNTCKIMKSIIHNKRWMNIVNKNNRLEGKY